jgi:hypothetical protein
LTTFIGDGVFFDAWEDLFFDAQSHVKTTPLYSELLSSSSSALFFEHLKKRLIDYFGDKLHFKNPAIPTSFLAESVVSGFLNILSYWIHDGMKETPEELEIYFEATLGPILA